MRKHIGKNFAIGLFITIAFLVIAVRQLLSRRTRYNQQGSVADLVKRGQLRSDRRGMYGSSKLCLYFIGHVIWCLVLDTAVDDHMDYCISVNPYMPIEFFFFF